MPSSHEAFESTPPEAIEDAIEQLIEYRREAEGIDWSTASSEEQWKVRKSRIELNRFFGPKRACSIMREIQIPYLKQAREHVKAEQEIWEAEGWSEEEMKRERARIGMMGQYMPRNRVKVYGIHPQNFSSVGGDGREVRNFLPVTLSVDVRPQDLGRALLDEINDRLGDVGLYYERDEEGNPVHSKDNEWMNFRFKTTLVNPPRPKIITDGDTRFVNIDGVVDDTKDELIAYGFADPNIMDARPSSSQLRRLLDVEWEDMPPFRDPIWQDRADERFPVGQPGKQREVKVGDFVANELAGNAMAAQAGLWFGDWAGSSLGLSRLGFYNVLTFALGEWPYPRKENPEKVAHLLKKNRGTIMVRKDGGIPNMIPVLGSMNRGQNIIKVFPRDEVLRTSLEMPQTSFRLGF